jgi:hypothetical protein
VLFLFISLIINGFSMKALILYQILTLGNLHFKYNLKYSCFIDKSILLHIDYFKYRIPITHLIKK